ncbi:MAG: sulfurtransferase, partial [Rhodoferax sp.]|nr:sulfurtransferase [Rhodoferax sp.]
MTRWLGVVWLVLACALPARADDAQPLRITQQSHEFVVQTPGGPMVIKRDKTACGAPLGFIQPLVPQPGVTPVSE